MSNTARNGKSNSLESTTLIVISIKLRMRSLVLALVFGVAIQIASAQTISSSVEVVTVYSQNGQFYLKSTPWDNRSPSLPGLTEVFAKGSSLPLYIVPRGFDSVSEQSNNLILSDDGSTIFYLISYAPSEDEDGLKSVSIYRRGELIKSYTASEITGCDLNKERCSLEYDNYDVVVDREKSNWGAGKYNKVFKPGVSDEEKFLSEYSIFSSEGGVYLTDSKKKTHRFSLAEAKLIDSRPFGQVYDEIKSKARFTVVELRRFTAPTFLDFPAIRPSVDTTQTLAATLGMKPYYVTSTKDEKYKRYGFKISGYLHRDGTAKITDLDIFSDLPKERIESFFAQNKFVTTSIPSELDRWFFHEEYFFFRKADDKLAIKERQAEIRAEREDLKKRLVAETIGDRYIPKDLGDAFNQLDLELPEVARKEMTALPKRDDMITYHMGLGMWMRNNWGLWGGSRLQKYFTDKRINHPDEMSSVILSYYWDWLQGKKDTWRDWEKNPKSMFQK